MSKMEGLQQALNQSTGKARQPSAEPSHQTPLESKKAKPSHRSGKDYTGAWLNPDFGASLRLVQLRKRRDVDGKKIYLDDLIAEALNDLFLKYNVPTVRHD